MTCEAAEACQKSTKEFDILEKHLRNVNCKTWTSATSALKPSNQSVSSKSNGLVSDNDTVQSPDRQHSTEPQTDIMHGWWAELTSVDRLDTSQLSTNQESTVDTTVIILSMSALGTALSLVSCYLYCIYKKQHSLPHTQHERANIWKAQ